jgi:hypothetical protein
MEIDVNISLYGKDFSPSFMERTTNLNLVEKNEPGEIGTSGKYKGRPRPYGSAVLRLNSPTKEYGPQVDSLLSRVESVAAEICESGVEEKTMWIVVTAEHGEQRNLEFSPKLMGRLSALGISLAISNYSKEQQ